MDGVSVQRTPITVTFHAFCSYSADKEIAKKTAPNVTEKISLFICFRSRLALIALWSLNDFIRSKQHRLRDRETDLFRRLEIYHQLELRWQFHRQISRLVSLEDFVDIGGHAPVAVREVRPVVHEPTSI